MAEGRGGGAAALRRALESARDLVPGIRGPEPAHHLRARGGAARARVGDRQARLDPRRGEGSELSARPHRGPRGLALGPRVPRALRSGGPGRARVLQPGDPAPRRGAPGAPGHRGEPARPIRGAAAGRGRAQDPLRHLPGPAGGGRLRWLLPPAEPGLGADPRLHHRGAAVAALHALRSPRRPGIHPGPGGEGGRRGERGPVREPLSVQGRLLPLAVLERHSPGRGGAELRLGPGCDGAEAGRLGPPAGPGGGRCRQPRQGRLPRQHEPRDPHPHERGDRHGRASARHPARARAAGVPADPEGLRGVAARPHQRHPGLLEDRGGQAGAAHRGIRPARGPGRHPAHPRPARRPEGPGAGRRRGR